MPPRRNMTITVDEDVARWARVRAAHEDTSVAQLVGDLLRRHMLGDSGYERAMKEHFAQKPIVFRTKPRASKRTSKSKDSPS